MQSLPAALGRRLQAILGLEGVPASVDELARLWQAKGGLTDPARLVSDRPTPHEVHWGGRRMWTHCILDALVLPFVDHQMADIRTTTPVHGEVIRVQATPVKVWTSHPQVLVSLGARGRGSNDVREACCRYILAFRDADEFAEWQRQHPEVMAVAIPVEQAWKLAAALAGAARGGSSPGDGCCHG